jgi:hypothetical protein
VLIASYLYSQQNCPNGGVDFHIFFGINFVNVTKKLNIRQRLQYVHRMYVID